MSINSTLNTIKGISINKLKLPSAKLTPKAKKEYIIAKISIITSFNECRLKGSIQKMMLKIILCSQVLIKIVS